MTTLLLIAAIIAYLLIFGLFLWIFARLTLRRIRTKGFTMDEKLEISQISAKKNLAAQGYRLSGTFEDFKTLELYFTEKIDPLPHDAIPDIPIYDLGACFGELLRKHAHGKWLRETYLPEKPEVLSLKLKDGSVIFPIERCLKRMVDGKENSLYDYAMILLNKN